MDERHNYEYDVDAGAQTAPAHVVRMVGNGKRVLEVGCGPGSITRILAQQNGCLMTGMELDPSAIKKVGPFCVQVIQADLNSSDWPSLLEGSQTFDVVVAADVLEHLYDPWNTLRRMAPLINQDGYLVISLPHVGHAAVMSCLINGDFEYRDWGLLDRTHIRFFGLKNIEALFAQAGLKIVEAKYVITAPKDTEFAAGWSMLSAPVQEALMSSNHSEVYQVVVKAIPLDRAGDAVPLAPVRREYHPPLFTGVSWKSRIGARLSPQLKQRIRKGFKRLGIKL